MGDADRMEHAHKLANNKDARFSIPFWSSRRYHIRDGYAYCLPTTLKHYYRQRDMSLPFTDQLGQAKISLPIIMPSC